jgi:hypothetical protein
LTDSEITSKPLTIAVAAFTDPVACRQISIIGKLDFCASSTEPIVKSIQTAIAYARMPLAMTV